MWFSVLSRSMKLNHKEVFACFLSLLIVQRIASDQSSDTTDVKWRCMCLSPSEVTRSSVTASNCSSSCDCEPGESSGAFWTCLCPRDGLPLLLDANGKVGCFTGCNCTSGSLTGSKNSRKHSSGKIAVIVLSICVIFTTLAFTASIFCYIQRREKFQGSERSSDVGSSYNSGTNLIIHRHMQQPKPRFCVSSLPDIFAGCLDSPLSISNTDGVQGAILQFSFGELEHATNKFSDGNLIGLGASSQVYRGYLKDGKTVAVKRLKNSGNYDADSLFMTEIALISRLHHCHVVSLIGYCLESVGKQTERILVFEFMPCGNLRESLDGTSGKFLDWKNRVSIALGAARGLEYLHEAAAPRILHRDVKSSNILLDENWRPKITDLGMAKHMNTDGIPSCSSSPACMQGTFGYFAPEYAIIGKASLKSDVFSFGVVLLELITGQKPIYTSSLKGEESLVIWAAPRLQNSTRVISELPDPKLRGNLPVEELKVMAYLAKECLLLDPDNRPSMSEVVQILLTIAPKLSRRRTFTVNLFQRLSSDGIRDGHDSKGTEDHQVSVVVDSKDIKKVVTPRHSLPLDCIHIHYNNDGDSREGDLYSSDYSGSPIIMTSSGDNRSGTHDRVENEVIDLIEPELETFSVHSDGLC